MDLKAAFKNGPPKKESFLKIKGDTVAQPRGLDLESAKVMFGRFNPKIEELKALVEKISVRTEEGYASAGVLLIAVNGLIKSVENTRKSVIDEPDKYVRGVNKLASFLKGKISPSKETLVSKISEGRKFLDAEAEKKKRDAEEELRKSQKALDEKYKELGKEAPQLQQTIPVLSEADKTVRTENGSLHTRTVMKCVIRSPEEVPREYCEPVQKLLNEAVKRGVREIPGCVIFEDKIPVTR